MTCLRALLGLQRSYKGRYFRAILGLQKRLGLACKVNTDRREKIRCTYELLLEKLHEFLIGVAICTSLLIERVDAYTRLVSGVAWERARDIGYACLFRLLGTVMHGGAAMWVYEEEKIVMCEEDGSLIQQGDNDEWIIPKNARVL
ncbi:unnamed protein product [Dovyalis caffra]|uniref:Uncharacterized protein n=1 Tax=Dovyalis caffra TaxID=77055 RepID=A0AAV1RPJ9_9ROSI|nr:unnamed protein product [Dovyalis caffra]